MTSSARKPRAQRNNNPGNLRVPGSLDAPVPPSLDYEGLTGRDSEGFMIFDSPVMGARAVVLELVTAHDRGQHTIEAIGAEWAPPAAHALNESWTDNVAAFAGYAPDERLPWQRDNPARGEVFAALLRAIAMAESSWRLDDATVRQALQLAGIPARRPGGAVASRTIRNASSMAALGSVSVGSLVTAFAGQLDTLDWRVGVAVVCCALIVALAVGVIRYRREDARGWRA